MKSGLTTPAVRSAREEDLRRIANALRAAAQALQAFPNPAETAPAADHRGPVTAADGAIDDLLFEMLPQAGEGWLSEERRDDRARLCRARVWVVDPLDGTREFVAGIPEWCVSIGLVEDGRAVAGGVLNPATNELFLGSRETGVEINGEPCPPRRCLELAKAVVLASRTEVGCGLWNRYRESPFSVHSVGSVAYKLALVAAGRADATWTLAPKHEWDVAGGVALIEAAGGFAATPDGRALQLNQPRPWLAGLMAFSAEAKKAFAPLQQWR